jgi:ATP-binding cassette subfamily B multidrug efflux pump
MSEATEQHEEEALGKAYDARLMKRLLAYLRPYRGMTAGALALILFSSALQLIGPLTIAVALDLFIQPQREAARLSQASLQVRDFLLARGIDPAAVRLEGLAVTAGIYLAALVLTFIVLYAQGYVMQLMGQYVMNDLRSQVFGHLQRLPIAFFDRNPIGRLVTR